jgi:hypothetical protein
MECTSPNKEGRLRASATPRVAIISFLSTMARMLEDLHVVDGCSRVLTFKLYVSMDWKTDPLSYLDHSSFSVVAIEFMDLACAYLG